MLSGSVLKDQHVIFFCSWYPSRVFPTNGDFIQRHAEAVSRVFRVTVLHVVSDPALPAGSVEVEEKQERSLRVLRAYLGPSAKWLKPLRFFAAYRRLVNMAGSCDVVHVHHVYPVLLFAVGYAMLKRLPCVVSEHWTGFLRGAFAKWHPLMRLLMRLAARGVSCFCPVTAHLGRKMQAAGFCGRYEPVPNVVNTDLFCPPSEEQQQGEEVFRFLHVSSMKDEHKNVSGILRVMARLQAREEKWELYLIGDKPLRYKAYATALGIKEGRIRYLDNLPQEELVHHFRRADLLLLFSRFENLPCVILEAFSCGLPVVSTAVGGIAEYFPVGFGRLISSEDEEALLEELSAWLRGARRRPSRQEMHAYAKEHFSPAVIGRRFCHVYRGELPRSSFEESCRLGG